MNVLFLNSIGAEVWGGGEKWMLTAGTGLRARGHSVCFCGRHDSLFLGRCAESSFEAFPLRVHGDFDPATILKVRGILLRMGTDIVIANFNKDVRLGGIAARLGTRAVLIARNGLPILPNNWRHRLIYKRLVSGIITNTVAIKERYLSYGWLDEDFVTVIYNGIDVSQPVRFDRGEVLSRLSLPDARPLVGIFGRLVGQKQHVRFLDVAKGMIASLPDAVFLILGDGPLRADLEAYAGRLGIGGSVRFLGFHREVMPIHSICDLVLLTSSKEGLPNAVQEAMLAGRAVVSFDVGGVRELIPDASYGVVVPPDDTRAMAEEATALVRSERRREEMGTKARQRILTEFSIDAMIASLEKELFRRLRSRRV